MVPRSNSETDRQINKGNKVFHLPFTCLKSAKKQKTKTLEQRVKYI